MGLAFVSGLLCLIGAFNQKNNETIISDVAVNEKIIGNNNWFWLGSLLSVLVIFTVLFVLMPKHTEFNSVKEEPAMGSTVDIEVDDKSLEEKEVISILPSENDIEQCVTGFIEAYRKELDDPEKYIKHDLLDEWEEWCKEGRQAPI
jgi:hypothetical protein